MIPWETRYSRAARLCAPRWAGRAAGLVIQGYWLNDNLYFFLKEEFVPGRGRVIRTPALADCQTGAVHEVIGMEVLSEVLGGHLKSGETDEICAATFAMPRPGALAVAMRGKQFLLDLDQRRVVAAEPQPQIPAIYSPDGRHAVFIREYDLWLADRTLRAERALTSDGVANRSYGRQSEVNAWAISYRKRPLPVGLWSADAEWFVTHRIDERDVHDLALVEHVPQSGGRPTVHQYKYPFPGDAMPIATLVAFHASSGRVLTFEDWPLLVTEGSPISGRTVWFDECGGLYALQFDRYCTKVNLLRLDLATGSGRVVMSEETSAGYLDLYPQTTMTPCVRTLGSTREIIWYSERDGFGHLYLYDRGTGELKNRITKGTWQVSDLLHVDEGGRRAYFLAAGLDSENDPARRSLCAVNLDGMGFEVLLSYDGDVFVERSEPSGRGQDRPTWPAYAQTGFSPDGRHCVARLGSVDRGNSIEVVNLRTDDRIRLASVGPQAGEPSARHFRALAADGDTVVHGIMFLPSDFDPGRRYPLVDYVYPGPRIPWKPQCYGTMRGADAMAIAELGFVVIMLDTRGVPLRGRSFHQAGYPSLFEPQLADHAAVVRQLGDRESFIDRTQVGVIGWSAGAAAAVRAMCGYAEIFKVGVAACGNYDTDCYYSSWSDKYQGRAGNLRESNRDLAHRLSGQLLLISGDMDENVHVSQTLKFVDSLIQENKEFSLLIVPNAGHEVLSVSGYALRKAWDHLVRHLQGEKIPTPFEVKFSAEEISSFDNLVYCEALR